MNWFEAHPAFTHLAVLMIGGFLGRQFFAYIENNEDKILAKGLALQRAKLKAIGANAEQIKAFDQHEALVLQKAADAAKADADQP